MKRKDLGIWAGNLPGLELAPALAAGLVISADRPLWDSSLSEPTEWADYLLMRFKHFEANSRAIPALLDPQGVGRWPPAKVLADAWNRAHTEFCDQVWRPLRLQLDGWQRHDPRWVLEVLWQKGQSDREGLSVFLKSPSEDARIAWNLPLRIGTLPDEKSLQLLEQLEANQYYPWLARFITLGPGHETCDLLLLPYSVPQSLGRLLSMPFSPQASFAFVLGGGFDGPYAVQRESALLLKHYVGAAGIGIQSFPERNITQWFNEFMANTSHDKPIDQAAYNAAEFTGNTVPIILSSTQFLDVARSSRAAQRNIARLRGIFKVKQEFRVSPEFVQRIDPNGELGLSPDGLVNADTFPRLVEALERSATRGDWNAESGDAKDFSELECEMAAVEHEPAPDRRFLQARVTDLNVLHPPVNVQQAMLPDHPYAINVRIAPPDDDWLAGEIPFPDEKVEFTGEPVRLTVVIVEPSLFAEPQIGSILLSEFGSSSECRFTLRAPSDVTDFRARIAVIHRNRVLQVVSLMGRITPNPQQLEQMDWITLSVDSVVRSGFQDLDDRRRFDAALMLNHTAEGTSAITALRDDTARWITVDRLRGTVDAITHRLSDVAAEVIADDSAYSTLDANETRDLLCFLAYHGRELYDAIVTDLGLHDLKDTSRIQVIAAQADRFFPVEFFYDRETPEPHARVCPHAREALNNGHCTSQCVEPERDVICPLGFWCMSRVIERHAFDPTHASSARGDFKLQADPSFNRNRLKPLRSAVFGPSDRVDRSVGGQRDTTQRDAVLNALTTISPEGARRAATWEEWRTEVSALRPSLLVLLPHTLKDDFYHSWTMEIGKNAQLPAGQLRPEHVRPDDTSPPPIVFLLGCETGIPVESLDSFVSAFRRQQAALVVTTLAATLGRHAAPAAIAFAEELNNEIAREARPFGEISLAVRRKLMARGIPAALALAVYGDADWILEPA